MNLTALNMYTLTWNQFLCMLTYVALSQNKKSGVHRFASERRFFRFYLRWISRKSFLLFHQVRDYTVSPLQVILSIYILHNLLITDWIIPLVNTYFIPLIKPVSQQGHHRLAESILILRFLLNPLDLPSVLPGDDTYHQHTSLLHPVLFHHLNDHSPGHTHPPPFCCRYTPMANQSTGRLLLKEPPTTILHPVVVLECTLIAPLSPDQLDELVA